MADTHSNVSGSLNRLSFYLKHLPDTHPINNRPKPDFRSFFPDFATYDDDEAVNRELEINLGPRTGENDTFTLHERGPGIEALAEVLQQYLEEFPTSFLLRKWLDDSLRAVEVSFRKAGLSLVSVSTSIFIQPDSPGGYLSFSPLTHPILPLHRPTCHRATQ